MNINKKAKPVFIIGFPRCASSTLTSILDSHPSIVFPENKGTNFFSTDEFYSGRNFLFHTYFQNWSGEKYFGDGNPVHSFLPYVSKRMHELFPDARLIFSLRDPVTRAYSNWWHNRETGLENKSFEYAVNEELNALDSLDLNNDEYWLDYRKKMIGGENEWRSNIRYYLLRGYYALHIKRFLDYYPNNQIHVLKFKDLKTNSNGEVQKIIKFLGLEMVSEVDDSKHVNFALKNDSILKLNNRFKEYGLNKYIPKTIKKGLVKLINSKAPKTEMESNIRNSIEDYYREKNIELETLLNMKLHF